MLARTLKTGSVVYLLEKPEATVRSRRNTKINGSQAIWRQTLRHTIYAEVDEPEICFVLHNCLGGQTICINLDIKEEKWSVTVFVGKAFSHYKI